MLNNFLNTSDFYFSIHKPSKRKPRSRPMFKRNSTGTGDTLKEPQIWKPNQSRLPRLGHFTETIEILIRKKPANQEPLNSIGHEKVQTHHAKSP